jgi:dihydroorotase
MEVFIEQAKLIYPGHPFHDKALNIQVKGGKITAMDTSKKFTGTKISGKTLFVSPGWVDIGTQCGEPGYEHRETLSTLSRAASKGGYTTLAVFPNTKPTLHSKSEIEFVLQKSKNLQTRILPIGSVSKQCQGKELAEIIDMQHSGAIAFSDGKFPVQDTGVMQRAMLYLKHFNGLLINQPMDESLASLGQMHEGKISQRLGLKGIPEIAEVIMLLRDFNLAGYSGVRLLTHLISSAASVIEIKNMKKKNKNISSSVSYLNLLFNDRALEEFESSFKQNPPLRSDADQKALQRAVKDQVIDIIVTNHTPLEVEKKDLEFAYADHGTIGLQTAFAAISTQGIITPVEWVQSVSINPRKILGLEMPVFEVGQLAELTIFDPLVEWTFTHQDIASLSKNTPFDDQKFRGKVLATISNQSTSLF